MLSQTLAVSLLAASTLASASQHGGAANKRSRAHMNKANKRHDGGTGARMTYYDTSVGLGACGEWHAPSEYTVALNSAQLALYGSNYPSPACGKTITISYGGKTAQATIEDECPSCPWGGLDLSEGLFTAFASTDVGVFSADWWYGGAATEPTTSKYVAPTTSAWVAPTTSTSEWVAPTTSSTVEWVAPTTTSTSEWVAPTTSSSEWVAPTTTSEAYVAPTTSTSSVDAASVTVAAYVQSSSAAASSSSNKKAHEAASSSASSSTEDAWVAPTSTEAAYVAPTTTEEAWTPAASATADAWTSNAWTAAEPETSIFAANGSMCSSPSSVLLFTNATLLYNGTTLDLIDAMTVSTSGGNITMPFLFGPNSTVSASFNGSSSAAAEVQTTGAYQNATALIASNATLDQVVGYCFNSTLYPLVFSPDGTISNGTAPTGASLNGTATFEELLVQMGYNTNVTSSI